MSFGRFIAIEGLDGCGKGTQIDILRDRIKNDNYWLTAEPTNGAIGKMIRSEYLSKKVEVRNHLLTDSLFIADRVEHITGEDGLLDHLNRGYNVISDRYALTGVAYMAANMRLNGINSIPDAIRTAIDYNRIATDILMPDLTILIDVDTNTALDRINAKHGTDLYENGKFLAIARIMYAEAINELRIIYPDSQFVLVDGSRSVEEIANNIATIIGGIA